MIPNKARKLRDELKAGRTVVAAGAHDGLSARLVEAAGFDAVWASSFEISTSHAVPDASIVTMSEYLEAARAMNYSVRIPIIADCDNGFGNSTNVSYMVRRYELEGIAAVCIEDKRFPKLNSFIGEGQALESVEEFCEKIKAGKGSQQTEEFLLIARTEALISGRGVDEALRRAEAYADAGADAVLVHSKARTADEVLAMLGKWDGRAPIVVVPTTYYESTVEELAAAGVQMVIYANHAIRAAVRAMSTTLAEVRERGTTASVESRIAPLGELFELQGMGDVGRISI
ncbi:isocitrate lyase/phosphoenolpyruvate mutase family protein [Amycolatopsis sp. MtRt-6]|uniref:isocitrate lyase/phosphoenolpyruvate mutase family protein n=1 Tax=Amycolatopsis sp. MtRt-6 TaxID=2792782 RepID=UPI001A8F3520|nr:isocitrate lyase/phosphoenolpyruvate mutase family protein [Amycolatopsis sp. MtRt-6]